MTRFPIHTIMTTDRPGAAAAVFASPHRFREAFEQRLAGLVNEDTLGVFILALANASHDGAMFDRLRDPLRTAFGRWCDHFDGGGPLAIGAAADDAEVFTRLRTLGFEQLVATRRRRLGPWELQFNPLRGLRPPRMSNTAVSRLHQPFNPDGFHFNKPFLRREIFWEGELAGTQVRLLFNKFPFAELHGLLVPQAGASRPQYLDAEVHDRVWDIAMLLGQTLPDVGFGYNAHGAHASVNHLYLQMFMRVGVGYPIESMHWRHNGGSEDYPLTVRRFGDRLTAWAALHDLHEREIAYNLVYRPGCLYLVERAMQGSHAHSGWTAGFAWAELAGSFTTHTLADFESLSAAQIEAELESQALRP